MNINVGKKKIVDKIVRITNHCLGPPIRLESPGGFVSNTHWPNTYYTNTQCTTNEIKVYKPMLGKLNNIKYASKSLILICINDNTIAYI